MSRCRSRAGGEARSREYSARCATRGCSRLGGSHRRGNRAKSVCRWSSQRFRHLRALLPAAHGFSIQQSWMKSGAFRWQEKGMRCAHCPVHRGRRPASEQDIERPMHPNSNQYDIRTFWGADAGGLAIAMCPGMGFSFHYDGKVLASQPSADWEHISTSSSDVGWHSMTLRHSTGLQVTRKARLLPGFDAVEYRLHLRNTPTQSLPPVSRLQSLDLCFANSVLHGACVISSGYSRRCHRVCCSTRKRDELERVTTEEARPT